MKNVSPYIENKIVNIEWGWRNEYHRKLNLEPIYERTEQQCGVIEVIKWDTHLKLRHS